MPVIAEGLLPFFVLAGGFVLLGLSQMHASAHGGGGIKGFLEGLVTKPIAALINLASQATRALTSRFAGTQLALIAAWFSAFATLRRFVFQSAGEYAHAAGHAIEAVWDAIPHEIERALAPVRRIARHADHAAARALARAEATIHALDHFKARVNARLRAIEHTVTVTLPHEIGRIRTRERELEHVYDDLRGRTKALERGAIKTFEWLRAHERSAAMAAFSGAVALALSRLGYGFLRCSSWRSLGRSLKCSDANILRDLLALATGILASEVSLTEFVQAMQAIEQEAVDELHTFIGP